MSGHSAYQHSKPPAVGCQLIRDGILSGGCSSCPSLLVPLFRRLKFMRKRYMAALTAGLSTLAAFLAIHALGVGKDPTSDANKDENRVALASRSVPQLPVTGCALFSSGVSYFQREAE